MILDSSPFSRVGVTIILHHSIEFMLWSSTIYNFDRCLNLIIGSISEAFNWCTIVTKDSQHNWTHLIVFWSQQPCSTGRLRCSFRHPPVASLVFLFAWALTASTKAASNDNLPQPLIRAEKVSIKITEDIYEKGTNFCKTNLRDRLVLNKGNMPYATKEIKFKLHKLWKTTRAWHMLSLGKGYYWRWEKPQEGGLNCVFGNFFFYVLDNCP